MKIQGVGPVPAGKEGTLTKGNRQLVAGGRPETVGEETTDVNTEGRGAGAPSQTSPGDDERQLLASLRELVDRVGPVKAADALGVTYRTVTRAIETNTLTGRMEDALKLRQLETGGAVAEPVTRRLDALERRQDELEAGLLMLAREVGAQSAKVAGDSGALRDAPPGLDPEGEPEGPGEREPDATPAAAGAPQAVIGRPRRVGRLPLGHPEVVTVDPVPDEEFDYAEAAPLVVEWRQARAAYLRKSASRVERARGGVRMCELEILLIRRPRVDAPAVDVPLGRDPPARRVAPGEGVPDWRSLGTGARAVLALGAARAHARTLAEVDGTAALSTALGN